MIVIDANSAQVYIVFITSIFAFLSLIFTGIMAYKTAQLHESFQLHARKTSNQLDSIAQSIDENNDRSS